MMAEYSYKAINQAGELKQGVITAESVDVVAQKLKQLSYTPIAILEKGKENSSQRPVLPGFAKYRQDDLISLTHQLATLQHAGIPLLRSLQSISEEMENAYLRRVLTEVSQAIESGKSFSEALAEHPSLFNELYIQMVRAGELAGILDQMLERLAQMTEHQQETSMQIRSAMQYPLIVLTTITIAFIFLMVFVVPRFAELFTQFHSQLPLPTRILLGVSFIFRHYWWGGLGIAGMLFVGGGVLFSTPSGRGFVDHLVLKIPVFGPLLKKIYLSRFAQVVALLAQGGVPVFQTLQVASGVVGNRLVAQGIAKVAEGIHDGKGI